MQTVAILARTNFYLRPYEDLLSTAGIRYRLLGRSGFWQQSEVRNILAFVNMSWAGHDSAFLTALRSPYHCTRFIRKKELIAELQEKQRGEEVAFPAIQKPRLLSLMADNYNHEIPQRMAREGFVRFIHSLYHYKDLSAGQAIANIVRDLRALEYYEEEEASTVDNSPIENIQELIRIAERFSTVREFLEYVRKVTNAAKSKKGIALGTVHSAKGAEFDTVFLTGAHEEMMPHKNGELEEEKRIFFVGASRAAKRLYISYAGRPSRFIEQFLPKVV